MRHSAGVPRVGPGTSDGRTPFRDAVLQELARRHRPRTKPSPGERQAARRLCKRGPSDADPHSLMRTGSHGMPRSRRLTAEGFSVLVSPWKGSAAAAACSDALGAGWPRSARARSKASCGRPTSASMRCRSSSAASDMRTWMLCTCCASSVSSSCFTVRDSDPPDLAPGAPPCLSGFASIESNLRSSSLRRLVVPVTCAASAAPLGSEQRREVALEAPPPRPGEAESMLASREPPADSAQEPGVPSRRCCAVVGAAAAAPNRARCIRQPQPFARALQLSPARGAAFGSVCLAPEANAALRPDVCAVSVVAPVWERGQCVGTGAGACPSYSATI